MIMAHKIIYFLGACVLQSFNVMGKPNLDRKIRSYVQASVHSCEWLVLRDLDVDADCPAQLRYSLLSGDEGRLFLRVPVRAVEAWVMADFSAVARWLQVKIADVPSEPETVPDPKQRLAQIALHSRSNTIRRAIAPNERAGSRVGPEYDQALSAFVKNDWSLERALDSCRVPSLQRAISALRHA